MLKTKELLRAIDVTRTVAKGGPDRRVVRLDVDDSGLRLSAAAGGMYVAAHVAGVPGGDAHTVGVIPDQLRIGVESIGRDDVAVSVDTGAVTLTAGARRVVVKTVEPPRPFEMPARPDKHDIDLTAADLAMRLPLAAAAASRESDRPALPGVSLWVHQGALRFVGTDGHRLHVVTAGAAIVDAEDGPLAWLSRAVVKHLGGGDCDGARIYAPGGAMERHWLESGGVTWSWEPPCPYPTWVEALPPTDVVTTVAGTDGLTEYMRAAAKIIDGYRERGARFTRSGGVLKADMPWSPDASAEESWPSDGLDFTIRLNPAYMADAMDAVGDNPVVELRDFPAPAIVRGDGGFAVVMPMRP